VAAVIAGMAVSLALAAGARPHRDLGLEPEVLAEINYVRGHPQEYADRLRDDDPTPATIAAIRYLESRPPAPPLEPSDRLDLTAARHADDEGQHGAFQHTGSDGSSAAQRMRRAGIFAGMLAEEMAAGQDNAEEVVRQLIIDEDVPGAGHRRDLLDPFLRVAGVGCAPHPEYRTICVIDLASAPPPRD
jgi:hypothetical protein